MGLLKKIFKPVAKVLDKVVPNEIKPFLPYAAAVAPFMMPAGFGTGFASGLFKTQAAQQMAARALLGGGANVLGQLSQEGSEGDINLLSAGLGALSGAMTAPGAADTFTGMTTASKLKGAPPGMFDRVMEGRSFLTQAKDLGLTGLAKGSEMFAAGIDKPFSMAGLKAATLPAAVATGDVMQAQARQLEKQAAIDAALAEAEALADSGLRGDAIRNAMRAYGFFTDEEIESTVSSAGYRAGGRVGFRFGGIDAAIDKVEDESIKESVKMVADMPDMDLMDLIEEFEITFKRKPMSMEELKQFYRENYEMESPVKLREKIKEKVTVEAKDGGLMATRINMENGGDLLALGEGFKSERLNKMAMDMFGKTLRELNADEMEMLREEFNIMKGVTEAKDGGLMDLGGKEMDLRKGGFVPIGKKERADDVPARLSKNEFVMTADAVRAAGGGSVNKGAKRMYNLMNTLEARA